MGWRRSGADRSRSRPVVPGCLPQAMSALGRRAAHGSSVSPCGPTTRTPPSVFFSFQGDNSGGGHDRDPWVVLEPADEVTGHAGGRAADGRGPPCRRQDRRCPISREWHPSDQRREDAPRPGHARHVTRRARPGCRSPHDPRRAAGPRPPARAPRRPRWRLRRWSASSPRRPRPTEVPARELLYDRCPWPRGHPVRGRSS
jgi:hypothetical protein